MAEESKTPQLDDLEKGPWPSFVKEMKRSAAKNAMDADLLGLVERSYVDKIGHLYSATELFVILRLRLALPLRLRFAARKLKR